MPECNRDAHQLVPGEARSSFVWPLEPVVPAQLSLCPGLMCMSTRHEPVGGEWRSSVQILHNVFLECGFVAERPSR
jgi:hypothetical protein